MADYRIAKRYALQGFPVLLVWGLRHGVCLCPMGKRCKTPGKHPIHSQWQRSATTDKDKLRQLCERYPDAHLGIMPPVGSVILDVDPRNGGDKTLKGLMNGHALPKTAIQKSGGGGRHLFFKGNPSGSLGKGIDVKRPGRGFVVAAPADHISGGKYSWKTPPWEQSLAVLPKYLSSKEEEREHDDTPPPIIPIGTIKEALSYISADDYHRWINIGQALKHSYDEDGEEVWLEWSKTSAKFKEGDEDKWTTLDRNRDRPLITIRSIMSIARRSGYRPLTKEFDNTLWALGDVTKYIEEEPVPLDWVFEPCIPTGKVTLVAGAGGSSKSYFTLTLAMQMACGIPLGPFKPTKPGKALLLVAEESRDDIHRRIDTILKHRMYNDKQKKLIKDNIGVVTVRGMDWRLVYHDEAGDLQETDRVDYIIDEIRALGDCRFVVLDPLVAFNGASENDNVEMARLMFTLDRIAERTNCAVCVIHHVSKGGQVVSLNDATQSAIRGASALVDNARSAILLTRMPRVDAPLYNISPNEAGRYVVCKVVKNNYGPHIPDTMFVVERGGSLRHAPEITQVHRSASRAEKAAELTEGPIQLLRTMIDTPRITTREISEKLFVSKSRVSQLQTELAEEGYLNRFGEGRHARYKVTEKGRKYAENSEEND